MSATTNIDTPSGELPVLDEARKIALSLKLSWLSGFASAGTILSLVAFLIGAYLQLYMMPKFEQMFMEMNVELPGLTILMLEWGNLVLFVQFLFLLTSIAAAVASFRLSSCSKSIAILLAVCSAGTSLLLIFLVWLGWHAVSMPMVSILNNIGG